MHVESADCYQVPRAEPLIIVQEISHRVVNEYAQAIAGIRLAAADLASPEASAALIGAAKRLMSYADAHRALLAPPPGDRVDLGDYLDRLGTALSASALAERGIRLAVRTQEVFLAPERCWRVGLIMAELITNSVRHGLRNGPGQILVEVDAGEALITCRVSDSGELHQPLKPGMGLGVVRGLAAELCGSLVWCDDANGRAFQLQLPLDLDVF